MKIKPDSMNLNFKEKRLIKKAIANNEFSIFASPTLDKFENDLAKYFNKESATILPNCTTAINVALLTSKVSKDKYIILPNLTHASVVYAVISLGYKIVVCDFKEKSYDLDLTSIDVSVLKKCGALIVSYLHGYPLNLKEILDFSKANNLVVIEDLAQGLGVVSNNIKSGEKSDFACLSFGECKTLRLGEGGAIIHKKDEKNIINKIRHVGEIYSANKESAILNNVTYNQFINNGLTYDGTSFNYRVVAYSYAFGSHRLAKLDKFIFNRQKKLKLYLDNLNNKNIKYINNVDYGIDNTSPISLWTIVDDCDMLISLMKYLINQGIPVGKFKYTTINKVPYFKDFIVNKQESMINSEYIREHSMFLPLYENITMKNILKICNLINEYNCEESISFDFDKTLEYFDGFFIK